MGLLARVESPTLVILAMLGLTIAFLLLRSRRYLARQEKGRSPLVRTARPARPQQGAQLDAPDDVVRWEVRMHDTARDLSGQLDSKMGALEHLIREADRAAARLEAALEAAQPRPEHTSAPDVATVPPPNSSDRLDLLPTEPTNQAEALKSVGAADRLRGSRSVPHADTEHRPPAEHRYEEIYLLADYGFDVVEIARRVGSPVGEVELILGLRRKR